MTNEIKQILKLLIESKSEKLSIRKISLLRRINYKTAYQAIEKLQKNNLISVENYGNIKVCSFNNKYSSLVYEVEDERRNELLKNKNLKVIQEEFLRVKRPFIALVFGSVVNGVPNKNSDIDILLIAENFSDFEQKVSLMPINVHLTAITYEEFEQMLQSKKFSVVSEALKKNVILYGIEEYYRRIENDNWRKNKRGVKEC